MYKDVSKLYKKKQVGIILPWRREYVYYRVSQTILITYLNIFVYINILKVINKN